MFSRHFGAKFMDPLPLDENTFSHIPVSERSLCDIEISLGRVKQAIMALDKNKGAGHDLIPPNFFK